MRFQSKQIPCLRRVSSQVLHQEQTLEMRLDDSMPAISRVIGTWGQVVLRGKEWRSGSVQVSGGVTVWVLYLSEEGHCHSVEGWVPFSWKVDLPSGIRDGSVIVSGLLRSVDGRELTPKKLMVRANMGLQIQILTPDQIAAWEPEEVPEHVCLRRQKLPVRMPAEAGEKPFPLDERLTLPVGSPKPDRILYYRLQPEVIDKKVMADKVVFRGTAVLQLVYLGEDGRLHCVRLEVPFAQYGELTGQYGEDAQAVITMAVTGLSLQQQDDGSLLLSGGMTGQFLVYEMQEIELVTDAYSTRMDARCKLETLTLPATQELQSRTIPCETRISCGGLSPVDAVFWPEQPCRTRTEAGLSLELAGRFQLLGYNREGEPEAIWCDWSAEPVPLDQDGEPETAAWPTGTVQVEPRGEDAAARAELLVDVVTFESREVDALSELELQEKEMTERPSLILRRPGTDSLWDIAKAAGSTEKAIREANALEGEPEPNRMLLIPVL